MTVVLWRIGRNTERHEAWDQCQVAVEGEIGELYSESKGQGFQEWLGPSRTSLEWIPPQGASPLISDFQPPELRDDKFLILQAILLIYSIFSLFFFSLSLWYVIVCTYLCIWTCVCVVCLCGCVYVCTCRGQRSFSNLYFRTFSLTELDDHGLARPVNQQVLSFCAGVACPGHHTSIFTLSGRNLNSEPLSSPADESPVPVSFSSIVLLVYYTDQYSPWIVLHSISHMSLRGSKRPPCRQDAHSIFFSSVPVP